MFFNSFDEEMRKIFNEDIDKHNVLAYIIYKVNYQETEYNGLKRGEAYFTYSTLEKTTNMSHKKALRIMKELEDNSLIKWVFKSKAKDKESIILLSKMEPVQAPVEEPVEEPVESVSIKGFEAHLESVKEPVKEPVEGLSSINISKNRSTICSGSDKKINTIYSLIDAYTTNEELRNTLNEFVQYRQENKKMKFTPLAMTKILNKLNKFNYTDNEKIECLDESIANGWSGVFELKKRLNSTSQQTFNYNFDDEAYISR